MACQPRLFQQQFKDVVIFQRMKPFKIVSGGQTGVDRAALEWALENGVPHGGWCPKGRLAEDGVIPLRFQLQESDSEDYAIRTRRNVQEADGTVIFSANETMSGGTAQTAEFARELGKSLLHLVSTAKPDEAARQLRAFIKKYGVGVLNVAGPRASQEPQTGEFVKAVLSKVRLRSLRR